MPWRNTVRAVAAQRRVLNAFCDLFYIIFLIVILLFFVFCTTEREQPQRQTECSIKIAARRRSLPALFSARRISSWAANWFATCHMQHAASCGFSLAGQLTSGNSRIQLATCNLQLADAPVVFDRFVWLMADPNRCSCREIHWVIQCNSPAGLSHNSASGDKRVTI